MAKNDVTPKAKKPKKTRWYTYMGQAFTISREAYSWAPVAILAPLVLGIVIGLIVGKVTGHWILWPLFFILLGIVCSMYVLLQLTKRASYARIAGMPGASAAVLDQIKRGWIINPEPVRFNARSQDMIFRAIGRPGVVLIGDGNLGRTRKLAEEERTNLKRIIPSVPVSTIFVGEGEEQTPLLKLHATMKKLPKKITNAEVNAVNKRLEAVKVNTIGIPKGIDPTRARPDRKGMRGK